MELKLNNIPGKKYTLYDYCSVILMCAGLIGFSLADQTVSPEFEPKGKIDNLVRNIVIC